MYFDSRSRAMLCPAAGCRWYQGVTLFDDFVSLRARITLQAEEIAQLKSKIAALESPAKESAETERRRAELMIAMREIVNTPEVQAEIAKYEEMGKVTQDDLDFRVK